MDDYIQQLEESNALRDAAIREAIKSLDLPHGGRGLDAGCGIGRHTMFLSETIGPEGRVTGLDISPEILAYAEKQVLAAGMSEQIDFRQGSVNDIPFDDGAFDWVWSVDCAGYAPGDPFAVVREMARVVGPSGRIVIAAWSSQRLLPGYPALEARLNSTKSGLAPYIAGRPPEEHFPRAAGWFRAAGLGDVAASTFAGGVSAPLSSEVRAALESLLWMRWIDVRTELSEEDYDEYQRLCKPDSPDFILNEPDYYAFFTYSMFTGRKSAPIRRNST